MAKSRNWNKPILKMLKANDVAGQLHRLSQPRPGSSCFPIWQQQQKRPTGICAFMLLLCLIKISFTLYFAFTLPLSVLFPDPLSVLLGRHFELRWRFRSRDLLCPRVIFPAATILENKKNLGTRLTVNLHLPFSIAFFAFLSFSYLRNFISTRARTLARVVTPLKIQKN